MEGYQKYKKSYFMPPESCYDWVKKDAIDKAPAWCSVDLRDGNQALIEPMSLDEKLDTKVFEKHKNPGSFGCRACGQCECDNKAVAGEYAQQPPDHNGFRDKGGGYGGVPRGSGISCGRVLFVS